jgi:branched-chain amino acid transport system substrate-binding protein
MHTLGLSKLYVTSDDQPYGASIAAEIRQAAPGQGLTLTSGASGADAVFYGGNTPAAADRALDAAATAAPAAKLFVPSGLYNDAFASGLSPAAQKNLYVSSPGFSAGDLTPAGRQFQSAFQSAYGHAPAPEAIFGYEAMSAVLAVLKQAGAAAGSRATVVSDFRSLHNRQSALGTYSINGGDTSIASFVFARAAGGRLAVRSRG